MVHIISYAQTGSTLPQAKVKLELTGFDFVAVPEVSWIDNQSNGIVRFAVGVQAKDGFVRTFVLDSLSTSNEQMLLCDSAIRAMDEFKLNGIQTKLADSLVRGTVTFSNPSPNLKTNAHHQLPLAKDKAVDLSGKVYRYPIEIATVPFSESGLPSNRRDYYPSYYISYIDKYGKSMKIDSTGAIRESIKNNGYVGDSRYNHGGTLVKYRSQGEIDSLFSNYSSSFKSDYRITRNSSYVQSKYGTMKLVNWTLLRKDGKSAISAAFFPCKTVAGVGQGQTTDIQYVGNNRYWVSVECDEGANNYLLNENGKVLLNLPGYRFLRPITNGRYVGGKLALDMGIIIGLNGETLLSNREYKILDILDDNIIKASRYNGSGEWFYYNIKLKKIIYENGDYEKSGRTRPLVK